MLQHLSRLIFWSSLLFIALFLWTVTGGQSSKYEFRDQAVAAAYYNLIFGWTPIAILLTLFGTAKKGQDLFKRSLLIFSTLSVAALTFIFLINNLFNLGFGDWSTLNIAYQHKQSPERQILEQRFDNGALGYGSDRVVEVTPTFSGYFWKVSAVDTFKMDTGTWQRFDKTDDVKFP